MNAERIEQIINEYAATCHGHVMNFCGKHKDFIKGLAQAISDKSYDLLGHVIAEAYQQGHSDGMQAAKEIGNCRIISYSDDIAPVMTIEEEEEVITTTKFDIY